MQITDKPGVNPFVGLLYTMGKKSKLLFAFGEHKGRDYQQERQKKLQKQAAKRKRLREEQNISGNGDQVNGANPVMSGALPAEGGSDQEWESDGCSDAELVPVPVQDFPTRASSGV